MSAEKRNELVVCESSRVLSVPKKKKKYLKIMRCLEKA